MIINPFWDDEYKQLDYVQEPFNNTDDTRQWLAQGYSPKFTGAMCDMRKQQPSWNHKFVEHFITLGWKDIGTSYYRMDTGTVLPTHQDTYKRYVEVYNLQEQEHAIRRAVVFLEPWASGHYLELDGNPVVEWPRGFCVIWPYDTPHMAANLGLTPRYTLQVTGHV
jgi:hypothetical protein